MRKIIILITLLITISFIILIYNKIFVHNYKIKIEAASAFYPFSVELVQEVYSEDEFSEGLLKMVSTSQAYEDIITGKTDIIIASEPSDEQKKMIKKSGVNLEFKSLYLEPLAILINNENNIDNLSIDQIQQIYYEDNSTWNTYQLERNNGSQTCFESIVKNNKLGNNHYEIKTMPKIVDEIALDKKGIGYAFYSYYSEMHTNNSAKIINVNGNSIYDKDYPLLFEVFLIYRKDNNNENILKIVNWIEKTEGQELD